MVTHLGPSQNCGHYTAIGQAPNSNYYQFDDSCVRPLPLSTVLGTNAYIMFYEKEVIDDSIPGTSTSSAVYGPHLPDNLLNREKSPLKLTFYRSDDRKHNMHDSNNSTVAELKTEVKQPVILNSTLSKSSNMSNSNSEPWVVKQNGEIEKVTNVTKNGNGAEKSKTDEDKKISFVIKREDIFFKSNLSKNDTDVRSFPPYVTQKTPEKCASTSKLVKPPKSPLEKLEEQMNKNVEMESHSHKNGNGMSSKLVPYDSESSGDERSDRDRTKKDCSKERDTRNNGWGPKPSRCASPQGLVVTTKSMHHAWKVSNEKNGPLLSPSLNGVTNNK